jgi:tripartite-type tricarboxylate transporter receptor subunit TctC
MAANAAPPDDSREDNVIKAIGIQRSQRPVRSVVLASLLGGLVAVPGVSQAQEPYFKGKNVTLLIGGTAGGGLDTAARIFARHAGRHIPGNPTITPQLMPGAGGIRTMEFLAASAPKDGTTIATVPSGPLIEPLVGTRAKPTPMTAFNALGAWANDFSLCASWHASGFKTLADAQAREMTVAGIGAAATPDTFPVVLNAAIGTKFKVITGYQGTQETIMAVERGETHGRCGWTWSSLKATKLNWLNEKKIHLLVQMGAQKSPLFPDVPFARDLAKTETDKQMLDLMFATLSLSNSYFAPPGTAPERLVELRKAFAATLADKEVIAEATRIMKEAPTPTQGDDMQKLLVKIYATPAPVVDRLKGVLKK